jgi:hypothetical protein
MSNLNFLATGRIAARFVSVVVVTCAIATTPFASSGKRYELSTAEIRTEFVGKIITDGVHWSAYLDPDGSVKAIQMGQSRKGRWKIDGKELCLSIPVEASFDCWAVARAAKSFIFRANGQDQFEVTAEEPSAKYHFD